MVQNDFASRINEQAALKTRLPQRSTKPEQT
jgi:hypothetical protein